MESLITPEARRAAPSGRRVLKPAPDRHSAATTAAG